MILDRQVVSCLIDDVMWQVVSLLWSLVMMLRVDYRCVVVASSLLLSIAFAVLLFYCIVEVYGHSVLLMSLFINCVIVLAMHRGPVQQRAAD